MLKSYPEFLETHEDYLNSDRALEKESITINKQMASMVFIDEGIIIDIIDDYGDRVKYVPTEEDYETRRNNIRAHELIAWSKSAMRETVYFSWSAFIFSFIVSFYFKGLITAYNKRLWSKVKSIAPYLI